MKSKTTAELPSLRDLMGAGAHFGHSRARSHPESGQFTFVIRDKICVIDLEKTQTQMIEAGEKLKSLIADGKTVILVGTKRQARDSVKTAADAMGMPYVTNRWLGGTLTNFATIRKNIDRLAELEKMTADDKEIAKYTKRERLRLAEKIRKLHSMLDGITSLTRIPQMLLVVDPHEEEIAVREAKKVGIPVMAVCDTDAKIADILFPIPANDDAPKAIEMILTYLSQIAGRASEKIEE